MSKAGVEGGDGGKRSSSGTSILLTHTEDKNESESDHLTTSAEEEQDETIGLW